MDGDCCWADGIQLYLYIDEYVRIRAYLIVIHLLEAFSLVM